MPSQPTLDEILVLTLEYPGELGSDKIDPSDGLPNFIELLIVNRIDLDRASNVQVRQLCLSMLMRHVKKGVVISTNPNFSIHDMQ